MSKISGRLLTLEVDGIDHSGAVSKAVVTSGEADSDFTSFEDARGGGAREYKLVMTLAQDAAAGSLWSEVYDNVGDTVPYVIAPYGNVTPSPTEPHFGGNAVIKEPDGDFIGGEANKSTTAVMTNEVEWECIGRPTKITA
jgi:hypothetical protein